MTRTRSAVPSSGTVHARSTHGLRALVLLALLGSRLRGQRGKREFAPRAPQQVTIGPTHPWRRCSAGPDEVRAIIRARGARASKDRDYGRDARRRHRRHRSPRRWSSASRPALDFDYAAERAPWATVLRRVFPAIRARPGMTTDQLGEHGCVDYRPAGWIPRAIVWWSTSPSNSPAPSFFSADQTPLTSRSIRFSAASISADRVKNTAAAALFGIENTNRGCSFDALLRSRPRHDHSARPQPRRACCATGSGDRRRARGARAAPIR